MKIYIGNESYEFSEEDLEVMYIDEGDEAFVYRHGDQALKIYRRYACKKRLSEEMAKKLSEISTKRILLPKELVYGDSVEQFKGYTTKPYVYGWPNRKIKKMLIDSFVSEIDLFKEDAEVIADNGFEIDDLYLHNIVYNGKLYMVDPGEFIQSDRSHEEVLRNNIISVNNLVKNELFSLVKVSKRGRVKLNKYFEEFDYIGDAIRDSFSYGETVNRYVKKMARKFYFGGHYGKHR